MDTTKMLAGLKRRFIHISLPVVLAVVVLTIVVSLVVGLLTPNRYYAVITFLALATGITIVIDQWPKLYRVFSIQDEELENAKMTQQMMDSRLRIEEARKVDNEPNRSIYLKLCREELEAVPKTLENKQFDLAWGLFHFVEEMLLLLYEKVAVISQLEIIAGRAQEVPEGKREGVNKVLAKARDVFEKDQELKAPHESEFRAYLKEALAAINHHRRLFHWHRGIYQTQVYMLMMCIVPLLAAFFLLQSYTSSAQGSPGFLAQIFILGAIGGVVSLLLSERSLGEGVTSFYYGEIGLLIKPALGAVGAVIVYFLFASNLLFHVADAPTGGAAAPSGNAAATGAIKLAVTPIYFYYALAFLSGFSERFFTTTVARLEGQLTVQSKT